MSREVLRIAGISDTHIGTSTDYAAHIGSFTDQDYRQIVKDMSQQADIIVHCGDFTDKGDEESLKRAADIFSEATVPVYGVPGNHDVKESFEQAKTILQERGNIQLLAGKIVTLPGKIAPVQITGITGFGARTGERIPSHLPLTTQQYDNMVTTDTTRLERSLKKMRNGNGIVLVHFDQTRDKGDDGTKHTMTEIGGLIDTYGSKVHLLLHGHDHSRVDKPRKTRNNVDVIDLAVPIHIKMTPGVPYRLIHMPVK